MSEKRDAGEQRSMLDVVVPSSHEEAARRAVKLAEELHRLNWAYYTLDAPEVSDAAYDALMRELMAIEAAYPDLVTPDSPTQRIGAPPSDAFRPVVHSERMYSLENAMNESELCAWLDRTERSLGPHHVVYMCELKIDGTSICAHV